VPFTPGLNVISGEISSGKTTLVLLVHGLLGGGMDNLVPEVRRHVRAVEGRVLIGDERFTIVRRPVSTATARVDIAGEGEIQRLPAEAPESPGERTFGQWLLAKLGLPEISIPESPSRPDSRASPVSINDYFLYCHLRQHEIDTSLLGHLDVYKNRKRRVVFRVLYGLYDADAARTEEVLRQEEIRLRSLRAEAGVQQRAFAGTPFENRAALVEARDRARGALVRLEAALAGERLRADEASAPGAAPRAQALRERVAMLDKEIAGVRIAAADETASAAQLRELINQLRAQGRRVTKAIVAQEYLLDFDFLRCPRCGAGVAPTRAVAADACYLCLQPPEPTLGREDLEREQLRLDAQVSETEQLVAAHEATADALDHELAGLLEQRLATGADLDFTMRAYVSDAAERIAARAAERATLQADLARFADYLRILDRLETVEMDIAAAEERVARLRGTLGIAQGRTADAGRRLARLDRELRAILEAFETPRLDSDEVYVNRQTFMPVIWGRPFEGLHSPGVIVQANVAHALAHQRTALAFDLALPNILLIDGLTSNIGSEGLDAVRKRRMYEYLIRMSEELGERLQIIVADNDMPDIAASFVRAELSVDDRLVRTAPRDADRGSTT
jgi:hypothetical protein